MNATRFHRAFRKIVRPLKRRLQATNPLAKVSDFSQPTLVLIAHPDDEVFCSGLICELLERQQKVHLVCFTRGEGGERGELPEEAKLSQVREKELTEAAQILGVTSITFLDYLDPAMRNDQLSEPEHDSAELLSELEHLLKNHNITHLVTHGSSGEYWHPAHLCLHRHARLLNRRQPKLQLWTFNSWFPNHPLPGVVNQDDPTHLSLDTSSFREKRLSALACHQSQKAIFERFGHGSLSDFIDLTSTEGYRKW